MISPCHNLAPIITIQHVHQLFQTGPSFLPKGRRWFNISIWIYLSTFPCQFFSIKLVSHQACLHQTYHLKLISAKPIWFCFRAWPSQAFLFTFLQRTYLRGVWLCYILLLWLVFIPRHSEDRSIGVCPVLAFEQGLIYANLIERKYHWYTIYHMYHIQISVVSFDIWFNKNRNDWNVDGIWKRLKSVASITIRPFANWSWQPCRVVSTRDSQE